MYVCMYVRLVVFFSLTFLLRFEFKYMEETQQSKILPTFTRNSTPKVQSALQDPACVAASFNLMLVSTIPVKALINASVKNITSIYSKSAGSQYCKRKKRKFIQTIGNFLYLTFNLCFISRDHLWYTAILYFILF